MGSSSFQVAVALFLIFASYETCRAADREQCSALCGDHKVSHPFRLKEFAEECGDQRYNLSCEHNQLLLYWQSGRYNVLSINFENYTIRVRDANVEEHNYSSLPRDSLADFNFSYNDPYTTTISQNGSNYVFWWIPKRNLLTKMMVYVRCKDGVNSSEIDETTPCTKASNWNIGSETVRDLGLEEGCGIEVMYMTSWPPALNQIYNHSCTEIHSMLLYGFELSWLNSFCPKSRDSSAYLTQRNKPRCRSSSRVIEFIHLAIWVIVQTVYLVLAFHTAGKFVLGAPFIIVLLIYKWRRRHLSMYDNIEDFLQSDNNIMPIRYSYKDIKKMTKRFKTKLGKGGYGSVFKGQLRSGRLVAIKILDKAKANGQEFINEVATLGRIHHVNVVQLIGYCVEGSKRALVYEFMQNGSLDKYIHSQQDNEHSLNCHQLYAISLGVARGIEYLHKGCNMKILHFDIKPHNILLDDNFNPKVSDFGLAKLCPSNDSLVSLTAARGTIGYMAPELFYRNVGRVSYKADIYSFGMLLMEMAGRRKNLNPLAEHSSQLYFPVWVYDQLNKGKEIKIVNVMDEEMKLARKMMIVGLWCIQTKPNDRPSMSRVVEMLERVDENLEMPQKPYLNPQDSPIEDIRDHLSSTSPSFDPLESDSLESISLLNQENQSV